MTKENNNDSSEKSLEDNLRTAAAVVLLGLAVLYGGFTIYNGIYGTWTRLVIYGFMTMFFLGGVLAVLPELSEEEKEMFREEGVDATR